MAIDFGNLNKQVQDAWKVARGPQNAQVQAPAAPATPLGLGDNLPAAAPGGAAPTAGNAAVATGFVNEPAAEAMTQPAPDMRAAVLDAASPQAAPARAGRGSWLMGDPTKSNPFEAFGRGPLVREPVAASTDQLAVQGEHAVEQPQVRNAFADILQSFRTGGASLRGAAASAGTEAATVGAAVAQEPNSFMRFVGGLHTAPQADIAAALNFGRSAPTAAPVVQQAVSHMETAAAAGGDLASRLVALAQRAAPITKL